MRQGVLDADVPGSDVRRAEIRIHRQNRAGHSGGASNLPGWEDRPGEGPVELRADESRSASGDIAGTGHTIEKGSGGAGVQARGDSCRSLLRGEDVKPLQRVNDGGTAAQHGPPTSRDVPGEAQAGREILRM